VAITRREFLATAGSSGTLAVTALKHRAPVSAAIESDREYWTSIAGRIADPVLRCAADGTLKARMPVEQAAGANRRSVAHLEAVGRLLAGLAPWFELGADRSAESAIRSRYAALAVEAIAQSVDPGSPGFLNFTADRQPLVDAAFLAQALLRAPRALLGSLDAGTKQNLAAALASTRVITPAFSNWLLFTAMVEAGLAALGASWDATRVEYAVREHEQWYKGDGVYGDGPAFHFDYYNSFVIHPMLVDLVATFADRIAVVREMSARIEERARRYAAIEERLIAPDGAFPPVGRSLAYRCGAFHLLAQSALRRALPAGVNAAQVRGALTAVIRRTLGAPGTFDAEGWLRIGFCGHQPDVGEPYISTGSVYLCSVAFLPLGLPATDAFWSEPPQPWTQQRAWSGQAFPIDHAL